MSADPHDDFETKPLDPNILSTPFKVQTNWHVITGAPCSGKTTIVDQLADRGFRTVPETARLYFEGELAKGRTIEEIREDSVAVEHGLIEMQLRFERALQFEQLAFLDRGLPDGLTFCRAAGLDPNLILADCFLHRYSSVFILSRLPIEGDEIRMEDDVIADLLDEWLDRDYCALGYCVTRVPVLPPAERCTFVLDTIYKQDLK